MSGLVFRLRASGLHLLVSAIIATMVAGTILFLWYPGQYADICGGMQLIWIVISVDIVLGPLLTFVAFDQKKKRAELLRDILVISILQVSGLTYGAHVVYIARPVAMVFEGSQFRVVTANDVDINELPQARADMRSLSLTGPVLLGVRDYKDAVEKSDAAFRAFSGYDIGTRPSFWQPYADSQTKVLSVARTLDTLIKKYPESKLEIERQLNKTGHTIDNAKFLPVLSRGTDWLVVIDSSTAKPLFFLKKDGFF
ncbi:TfpX/TfpZ family type IV pilin accessory protein [Undibacterium sp. WLX3042]|uniref:TfpX/TfpZ family type IV pilin accessory protein n=1 Tax=Undibacterium sp. WLX3042 TaxID=3412686 RepID=UPI003C2C9333